MLDGTYRLTGLYPGILSYRGSFVWTRLLVEILFYPTATKLVGSRRRDVAAGDVSRVSI